MSWYPGAWTQGRATEPWGEVGVPDPGSGRLFCRRLDDRFAHLEGRSEDAGTYAGPQMAELLDSVTDLALGQHAPHVVVRPSSGRPMVVALDEAAALLPTLQKAVALAVGGEDRFERVWVDPESPRPRPLCEYCNEGSLFGSTVTISAWCSEHGHTPFGTASYTTWETAHADHASQARSHRDH